MFDVISNFVIFVENRRLLRRPLPRSKLLAKAYIAREKGRDVAHFTQVLWAAIFFVLLISDRGWSTTMYT